MIMKQQNRHGSPEGFDIDYYILLDVRNEAAVAGLAVKDFRTYYYNNRAYTTLYKQISKDRSLEEYCVRMQQSANNKLIALGIFLLLVVVCLAGYYILYLRHRLHYRYNMEQVFEINQSIFSVAQPGDEEESNVAEDILKKLSEEMNELFPIADMALALYDEKPHLCIIFSVKKERTKICVTGWNAVLKRN